MAVVDLCSFNHVHKSTAAMNYFFPNMTNTIIFMSLCDLIIRYTTTVPFSPLHIWIRILVVYVVKIARFFHVNLVVCFDSILPKYTSAPFLLFSGINPSSERHIEICVGCWSLMTIYVYFCIEENNNTTDR